MFRLCRPTTANSHIDTESSRPPLFPLILSDGVIMSLCCDLPLAVQPPLQLRDPKSPLKVQLSLVLARANAHAQQMFAAHQAARLVRIVPDLMQ